MAADSNAPSDHTSPAKETKNIAQANAALVETLKTRLEKRLNRKD